MDIEWGALIQAFLMTLIQVLLPVALSAVSAWAFAQFKRAKAQMTVEQYEFAETLVRQFVLAAEQAGLIGMIEDIGEEKKRVVIAMAEEELAKHGIKMDLKMLDAMIESIVYDAFNWEKQLQAGKE